MRTEVLQQIDAEARQELVPEVNAVTRDAALQEREAGAVRHDLEARVGQVWDTEQLRAEFDVVGFGAPFVTAVRKSDNKRGNLTFTHSPRFYHSFYTGE